MTIPRAISVASLSTYILGFAFNLALVLCMGPGGPVPLLSSPSGQPVVELFTQALGRAPAIFFTLCGVIIMNLVAIPGAQAGSRMFFALARDELVPLACMWTRVDVKTGTPIPAVWGYAVAVVIVNLLGLVSGIAIAAVFTVCAIALNVSYLIPILCKMMYPNRFERGPWHLGRWSTAVNIIAVFWNTFIAIILFLPLQLPVTPSNVSRVTFTLEYCPLRREPEILTSILGVDELCDRGVRFSGAVCKLLLGAWPELLCGARDTILEAFPQHNRHDN